jgi:hypothetical protein
MDGMFFAEVLPLGAVGWTRSAPWFCFWHRVSCGQLTNRPVARLKCLEIHAHVGNPLTVGERNVSVDVVERLLIFVWTAIDIMISAIRACGGKSIDETH